MPTTREVLQFLAAAGTEGITSGQLARRFNRPDSKFNYVVNKVNIVLNRQAACGRTIRSAQRIHLDTPRRNAVYRWWITPNGIDFLAHGSPISKTAIRAAAQRARDEAARRADTVAALTAAGFGRDTDHRTRRQVIAQLYGEGLRQTDIARIFGLTRERVRQIINGLGVTEEQKDNLIRVLAARPGGMTAAQIRATGIDFPGVNHTVAVFAEACQHLADQGLIEGRIVTGGGVKGRRMIYTLPQGNP